MVKGYEDLIARARYSNLKHLSESEKTAMLWAMRANSLVFGAIIMGDPDIPMHYHVRKAYNRMHIVLNSHLENLPAPSKTAIVGPRTHAKTTFIDLIYPLKRITFGQEHFVLMISESETQSIFNLEAIGNEVEYNPKYIFFFGKRRGETWGQETKTIITRIGLDGKEDEICKLLTRGVEQRVRGLKFGPYRPTLTIGDDFEGEANALTENERQKVRRWINAQVVPGSDSARIIFIGTIIDEQSYLNRIAGSEAWRDGQYKRKGWKVFFFQAIQQKTKPGEFVPYGKEIPDKNGVPTVLWPERRPFEWLDNERERLASEGDEAFFYQEYQNIPYTDSHRVFRKEDIQYWDGFYTIEDGIVYLHIRWLAGEEVKIKVPVNVFMGSDPASSENIKADYTVHMTTFYDKENNTYVWDYFRGQVTPMEGADELWERMEAFGEPTFRGSKQPKMVNIEKTGHVMLENYITRKSKEANRFYNIMPRDAIKNKYFRIKEMQPRFASRSVFIRKIHTELEHELLSFRSHGTVKKDTLDALKWALEEVWGPDLEHVKADQYRIPQRPTGYDWQTGMPIGSLREYERIAGKT